jgi:hypothetical protein
LKISSFVDGRCEKELTSTYIIRQICWIGEKMLRSYVRREELGLAVGKGKKHGSLD